MTGGRNAAADAKPRPAWPGTLAFGLGLILVCQALLFVDLSLRGWAVVPADKLAAPSGTLHGLGRWVAVNMTPLCWLGVLFTLDGLLSLRARSNPGRGTPGGSPARTRPRRFAVCFLASIPIWLIFEWFNFSFLDAWRNHGLPEKLVYLYTGYFFSFGAICPAMFLIAELYQQLGLWRVRRKPLSLGPPVQVTVVGLGLIMLGFPFVLRDSLGTLTLWLAWIFVLDPINHRYGAPSLIGDWRAGRLGRTLALMAGGSRSRCPTQTASFSELGPDRLDSPRHPAHHRHRSEGSLELRDHDAPVAFGDDP